MLASLWGTGSVELSNFKSVLHVMKTEKDKFIEAIMKDARCIDFGMAETLWWYSETPERRLKLDKIVAQHKDGTLTNKLNEGCTDWSKFENNEIKGSVTVTDPQ